MSTFDNGPSIVDEEALVVRHTIRIAASIDAVWRAVTDPVHISRWFGDTELDGTGAGATGTMSFPGYGAIPLRVDAIDEPHSVTYTWGNDDAADARPAQLDDATATTFTFTLEPIDSGTQLTVVETGFERTTDPVANVRDHGQGWLTELDKLVALLESGS